MKNIFLLFILFTSLSAEINSVDVDKIYNTGLKFYKEHNFKQSYQLFSQIFLKKLTNSKFNFYFGRSAYETGHYEVALAAFERVDMLGNGNIRNTLEVARTYYMLKMYEDAEIAFKKILANPHLPKNIRINIEYLLSNISQVQKKSFTYAKILTGILYDSNVNYGSIDNYQYGGATLQKIAQKDDFALEVLSDITNIYDIGDKNSFAVKNNFSFYVKEYHKESAYNTLYLTYSPSLLYKERKYTAELALNIDRLYMNHIQYLSSFSIMPKLQYNHSNTLFSLAYLKYQIKKFKQSSSLDAKHYEIAYGLQKILSPRSYIQNNLYFIKEKGNNVSQIYVDYNEIKTDLSYGKQFSTLLGFDLYAQIRYRKYNDFSYGFNSKRDDIGGLSNVQLSITLNPSLHLNFKSSYEYVHSNQGRFSYEKYTLYSGITKTF